MKLKNFFHSLIFFVVIVLGTNNINFNIYANSYNTKSNYKLAMEPVPPGIKKYARSKPYLYNLAIELILEEAKKAGLEFSKPDENFTINKFYCFTQDMGYYTRFNNADRLYYIPPENHVYYYNNVETHPSYIDYKNKIALIIQDKNTWYDDYHTWSYTITKESQIIEDTCIFTGYESEDDYRVIRFSSNNFLQAQKIEDIQQSIADILSIAKNYSVNSRYCDAVKKEVEYYTYQDAYEHIRDSKSYVAGSPFIPSSGPCESLKINNCFVVFYDKLYFTYYYKVFAYDLYTTRYYLNNIDIVPDFVDKKNKIAILLYDKYDWDNEENSNPDYFINHTRNNLTKILKTEDEYKDYLNNDEYYLIVLNKEIFLKSSGNNISYTPPSLYEISALVDQYRNQN